MSLEEYAFKRELETLREKRGRGTELISLYIPGDKQISDVVAYLREERGSASNIKSKQTRDNVQGAIDSILARLKYYRQPPERGIAIFCGALPTGGDRYDIETIVVEPPQPITSFSYRCDSTFVLDKLESMLHAKHVYGLIVVDWQESTVGILNGTAIEVKDRLDSMVPSKHRMGGQSAHRFQENHRLCVLDHFKKTGEVASQAFIAANVEGIIIGGFATKEDFARGDFLHYTLRDKVLGTFDVGYTNEFGLRELVERAGETLVGLDIVREKELVERFMRALVDDKAAYGPDSVRGALQSGAVDMLLVSESFADQSTIREFSEMADGTGAAVEFISQEGEGERLHKVFGGIVATLRYRVG